MTKRVVINVRNNKKFNVILGLRRDPCYPEDMSVIKSLLILYYINSTGFSSSCRKQSALFPCFSKTSLFQAYRIFIATDTSLWTTKPSVLYDSAFVSQNAVEGRTSVAKTKSFSN